MAQNKSASLRESARKIWMVKKLLSERFGALADVLFSIGRVGENQIEHAAVLDDLGNRDVRILGAQFQLIGSEIERFEIGPDHVRGPTGFFNNDGTGRATAQGFKRECA